MSPHKAADEGKADQPATFEAALQRLEALVTELEEGDVPLEKSLQAFEEAQKLIAFCEQKLHAAEQALKQLAKEAGEALGPRRGEQDES